MKAVLTADIISSTENATHSWMAILKETLNIFGIEGKDWEIYRGDEFQIILQNPLLALNTAFLIKSALNSKGVDVRIALGFGIIDFVGSAVKDSNGSAFVNSGRTLQILKEANTQNICIKSDHADFDEDINLKLELAECSFKKWSKANANAMTAVLQDPQKNQQEISSLLKISQPALSKALKRANLDTIQKLDQYFRKKLRALL